MALFVKNVNVSLGLSLTALRVAGFFAPEGMSKSARFYYNCCGLFCFMYILGIYVITQTVDLILVWGDLALMTSTGFLLFTNLAQVTKLVYLMKNIAMVKAIISETDQILIKYRGAEGKSIIKSCNRETLLMLLLYVMITTITISGWISSSEPGQMLFRGWYPYDISRSPAHQLTYLQQASAIIIAASLNIAKDTLVASLIAQCRCRLRLLGMMLRNLCDGMDLKNKHYLTPEEVSITTARLRLCVKEHQQVVTTVTQLQICFSAPTFAQFFVSLIIICVTAFQMVSQTGNFILLVSMATYLLNMTYQVFLYCYQGHQLAEESTELSVAAYNCPWYQFPVQLRRRLLIVMTRTRRPAKLTAGGFTTLSLASFMAVIKASYSLFTLLQQVEDK